MSLGCVLSSPYLVSSATDQLVTRTRPTFATQLGIADLNMFDVHDTPSWDLTDAVWTGLGLPNAAAQSLPDWRISIRSMLPAVTTIGSLVGAA